MTTIISIWLSILPLVVWNSHFEVPKVFYLISGSFFVLLMLILNINKFRLHRRDYWYICWLIVLSASSFLGDNALTSILGGSYRHQGVIFFVCLWLILKFIELLNQKEKVFLYKCVSLSLVLESLIVILGFKLGTLGETNAVSGLLAVGIFFILKSFPKWTILFPLIAMIVEFSKSGFLSLLPFVFKKVGYLLIIVAVALLFVLKPINSSSRFENREVIWNHAINIIKAKPILGYGAETNEVLFDKAFYESGFPLSNLIVDRSHNLFLDVTIWSGILGLICFIGFIHESLKIIDFERKKALQSFLIYSFFQPVSVAHWILLILII